MSMSLGSVIVFFDPRPKNLGSFDDLRRGLLAAAHKDDTGSLGDYLRAQFQTIDFFHGRLLKLKPDEAKACGYTSSDWPTSGRGLRLAGG